MFIIYDEDGVISHTVSDPTPPKYAELLDGEGTPYIEIDGDGIDHVELLSSYYVLEGVLTARPTLDLPTSLDMTVGDTTSLPVPTGATVILNGEQFTVDDGLLELEADIATEYSLRVMSFPYMPHDIEVTVNEA